MKVITVFRHILQKGNPFDMIPTPLHNLITKELASQETEKQILDAFHTEGNLYFTLHKARYEDKTTRISSTIHKVMLPAFDSDKTRSTGLKQTSMKKKSTASAHRMIQIAQARRYDMKELFRSDLSDSCSQFDEQGLLKKQNTKKCIAKRAGHLLLQHHQ